MFYRHIFVVESCLLTWLKVSPSLLSFSFTASYYHIQTMFMYFLSPGISPLFSDGARGLRRRAPHRARSLCVVALSSCSICFPSFASSLVEECCKNELVKKGRIRARTGQIFALVWSAVTWAERLEKKRFFSLARRSYRWNFQRGFQLKVKGSSSSSFDDALKLSMTSLITENWVKRYSKS